ncbi:uncharacterized protein V1518DRAFT_414460 [Limtongia smithiae]|uniref:uncharacterized protein n=1 Tax=Limtongia smithiae TaxID=1125753 RepID=UPI0034CF37C9
MFLSLFQVFPCTPEFRRRNKFCEFVRNKFTALEIRLAGSPAKYRFCWRYVVPEYPALRIATWDMEPVYRCKTALTACRGGNICYVGFDKSFLNDVISSTAMHCSVVHANSKCRFVTLVQSRFDSGITTQRQVYDRFRGILNELKQIQVDTDARYVLVIRDIHNYLGPGSWAIAYLLRQTFLNEEISIIGTTTEENYERCIAPRPGVQGFVFKINATQVDLPPYDAEQPPNYYPKEDDD